jgi:hypothetical protein
MALFSWSKLQALRACTHQAELEHVLKKPANAGQPAQIGSANHSLIEDALRLYYEEDVSIPTGLLRYLSRYPQASFPAVQGVEQLLHEVPPVADGDIVLLEQKRILTKEMTPYGGHTDDADAYCTYICDMVIERGDGSLVVIDWKSGWGEQDEHALEQVRFYAWCFCKWKGIAPDNIIVAVGHTSRKRWFQDETSFAGLEELGADIWEEFGRYEAVMRGLVPGKPRVGEACRICDVRGHCEKYQEEIRNPKVQFDSAAEAYNYRQMLEQASKDIQAWAKKEIEERGPTALDNGKVLDLHPKSRVSFDAVGVYAKLREYGVTGAQFLSECSIGSPALVKLCKNLEEGGELMQLLIDEHGSLSSWMELRATNPKSLGEA